MDAYGLVEAVSAALGGGAVTAEAMRRYWRRREDRQAARFQAAVSREVAAQLKSVLAAQRAAEDRQGRHLDRQDRHIAAIARQLAQLTKARGPLPPV